MPLDAYGPQDANGYRRNPIHLMSLNGGDDEMTRRMGDSGGPTEQRIAEVWRSPFRFTDDIIATDNFAVEIPVQEFGLPALPHAAAA